MMLHRKAALTLGLLTLIAARADAQVSQNTFQVAILGGWQSYQNGSGLDGGGTIAGDATYYVSQSLGFGVFTDFTFAETDGSLFTPAALSFVDSTTFTIVNQGVEVWGYGAHAKLQLPSRSIAPFLLVGAGGYTVFLDAQQNSGNQTSTGFMARFAAGVDFAVSSSAGFQISVSDSFYPSWDPLDLTPTSEEFQNSRFPELNPDPDELSDSVHNFRLAIGVTLVPGG